MNTFPTHDHKPNKPDVILPPQTHHMKISLESHSLSDHREKVMNAKTRPRQWVSEWRWPPAGFSCQMHFWTDNGTQEGGALRVLRFHNWFTRDSESTTTLGISARMQLAMCGWWESLTNTSKAAKHSEDQSPPGLQLVDQCGLKKHRTFSPDVTAAAGASPKRAEFLTS